MLANSTPRQTCADSSGSHWPIRVQSRLRVTLAVLFDEVRLMARSGFNPQSLFRKLLPRAAPSSAVRQHTGAAESRWASRRSKRARCWPPTWPRSSARCGSTCRATATRRTTRSSPAPRCTLYRDSGNGVFDAGDAMRRQPRDHRRLRQVPLQRSGRRQVLRQARRCRRRCRPRPAATSRKSTSRPPTPTAPIGQTIDGFDIDAEGRSRAAAAVEPALDASTTRPSWAASATCSSSSPRARDIFSSVSLISGGGLLRLASDTHGHRQRQDRLGRPGRQRHRRQSHRPGRPRLYQLQRQHDDRHPAGRGRRPCRTAS